MFIGGCGRFFEGTAEQMYAALVEKLGSLPDNTKVFCGHEYTLQNLEFAKHVENDNQNILDMIEWATEKRNKKEPTVMCYLIISKLLTEILNILQVPSTIGEEKKINPFMRVNETAVQKHAGCGEGVATMKAIRKEKDTFKG